MKHYRVETTDSGIVFFKEFEKDSVSFHISNRSIYPCSVVPARYGGVYEGGAWLAFPKYADRLPDDYDGSDVPCACFWDDYNDFVGKGDTPQEAYDNLLEKLNERIAMETK